MFTAFLDACVLVPVALSDTLLRTAECGLFRPAWSSRVLSEVSRAVDQLRRAAVLAGYGVLQPGVLIALTDRSHALAEVLADVPPTARVRLTTLGLNREDAADAAAVAWDLEGLAGRFREHVTRLDALRPDGPEAFRTYVEALQPALPDTLREPAIEPP